MLKIASALAASSALLVLGGCAYDYLQRTDRVAYHAGDAVQANMAIQTVNPSKDSQYLTTGLGKNSNVIGEPSKSGGEDTDEE